jgi:hypothetical protein
MENELQDLLCEIEDEFNYLNIIKLHRYDLNNLQSLWLYIDNHKMHNTQLLFLFRALRDKLRDNGDME